MPQALDGVPSEPVVIAESADHEPAEAEPSSSQPGVRPGFPGDVAGAIR
ncbi:hypothetical protein FIV07_15010 [Mycobacterium sp. THAF192]|nr:hypothetical protein FIV07_15010 [Mycobacterium sp. THAF192]